MHKKTKQDLQSVDEQKKLSVKSPDGEKRFDVRFGEKPLPTLNRKQRRAFAKKTRRDFRKVTATLPQRRPAYLGINKIKRTMGDSSSRRVYKENAWSSLAKLKPDVQGQNAIQDVPSSPEVDPAENRSQQEED